MVFSKNTSWSVDIAETCNNGISPGLSIKVISYAAPFVVIDDIENISCSANWMWPCPNKDSEEGYKMYTAMKHLSKLCIDFGTTLLVCEKIQLKKRTIDKLKIIFIFVI